MGAVDAPQHGDGGIVVSGPVKYQKLEEGGYQTLEGCFAEAPFLAGKEWSSADGLVEKSPTGELWVGPGFKWDGPSVPDCLRWVPGILIDKMLEPSLFHDSIARECRTGRVDYREWKPLADRLLVGVAKVKGVGLLTRALVAEAMHTDAAWNAFKPQPATGAVVYVMP